MTTICPGCGWDLTALGPPMGAATIPDLGGYCADCVPCKKCGTPADGHWFDAVLDREVCPD